MPTIYDNDNILYTERYNFDFLLNDYSENWFMSGTRGLWQLTSGLIACYTAERRLNFLNDLNEFILNHYIKVFNIHGKTFKCLREYNQNHFGIDLCQAAVYDTNDKMRNDISAALLKFLEIIDLRSYYKRNALKSYDRFEIRFEKYKYSRPSMDYEKSVPEIYDELSTYLYRHHPLINGDFTISNILRLVNLIKCDINPSDVLVVHSTTTRTTTVISHPKEKFEDISKEIAMYSYQCVHRIMCTM